jgi:hypothetical protein
MLGNCLTLVRERVTKIIPELASRLFNTSEIKV